MKKQSYLNLLALVLCMLPVLTWAQSKIAVQSGASVAYFDSLGTAMASVVDGDVIYLPGGLIYNETLHINRQVTMIGVGFDPDSTTATGSTIVPGTVILNVGASNSVFIGIHFSDCFLPVNYSSMTAWINNVYFLRCHFQEFDGYSCNGSGGTNKLFSNYTFSGCIFEQYVNASRGKNLTFQNCVLGAGVGDVEGLLVVENCIINHAISISFRNGRFLNNVFVSLASNSFSAVGVGNEYDQTVILTNNVFERATLVVSSAFDFVQTTNNIFNVVPTSVFASYTTSLTSPQNDLHLLTSSPASSFGIGGTDCGIYGGANPWKEGALPPNPHIQAKSIGNVTNAQGELPVTIRVAAQGN